MLACTPSSAGKRSSCSTSTAGWPRPSPAPERSTAIHARLTRVAVAGEGPEGVARAVHELTGFAVAVEDRYGNLRAWAGPTQPNPYPKESAQRRGALVDRAL